MEFFRLLGIRFLVGYRNLKEFLKVVYLYYSNRSFAKLDIYLLRWYINQNPYRIAKQFLMEKGEKEIYAYGETPLTTLDKIARECKLTSTDVVYELGCGRGRSCFWLHFFVGCKVVGIEYIPTFVHIAQHVRNRYGIKDVKFQCQDMLEVDYSDATVIYFYGTIAEDAFIEKLIEKLRVLKPGTKVITVSYPLTDPMFVLIKTFPAPFTWGTADVYLQIRK